MYVCTWYICTYILLPVRRVWQEKFDKRSLTMSMVIMDRPITRLVKLLFILLLLCHCLLPHWLAGSLSCVCTEIHWLVSSGSLSYYSELTKPQPMSIPCMHVLFIQNICHHWPLHKSLYCWTLICAWDRLWKQSPQMASSMLRVPCLIHSAHLYAVMSHTACTSAHVSSLSPSSTLAGVLGLLLLEVAEGEMLYVSSWYLSIDTWHCVILLCWDKHNFVQIEDWLMGSGRGIGYSICECKSRVKSCLGKQDILPTKCLLQLWKVQKKSLLHHLHLSLPMLFPPLPSISGKSPLPSPPSTPNPTSPSTPLPSHPLSLSSTPLPSHLSHPTHCCHVLTIHTPLYFVNGLKLTVL